MGTDDLMDSRHYRGKSTRREKHLPGSVELNQDRIIFGQCLGKIGIVKNDNTILFLESSR